VAYEQKAERGEIKPSRTVPATDLWRKMLSMLFETGHPWITFKDACNVRSPQQHAGCRAFVEPVHRDHAQHQRHRNGGLQPGLGQPGAAPDQGRSQIDHAKLRKTVADRDAHARQRHRHQLLRGQEGP
jgi:ribonucleoside-diphosphate reductase alpha chain